LRKKEMSIVNLARRGRTKGGGKRSGSGAGGVGGERPHFYFSKREKKTASGGEKKFRQSWKEGEGRPSDIISKEKNERMDLRKGPLYGDILGGLFT